MLGAKRFLTSYSPAAIVIFIKVSKDPCRKKVFIKKKRDTDTFYFKARYVELISGSFSSNGILRLKSFNDVTDDSPETKYARFSLDLGTEYLDDELSLKFYGTQIDAESDVSFFNPIVYARDMDGGRPFERLRD